MPALIPKIMRQKLTKEQTESLKKMGFPEPENKTYSIGELISFLPKEFIPHDKQLLICWVNVDWMVTYKDTQLRWISEELSDSLFKACVFLKENGIIK